MHHTDKELFGGEQLLRLHNAAYEFCWLLVRGYVRHSAIRLVGNNHRLTLRQRLAMSWTACSNVSRELRINKCLPVEKIKDQQLVIDGFNLIITVETAMAGGLLLVCCDGSGHCRLSSLELAGKVDRKPGPSHSGQS